MSGVAGHSLHLRGVVLPEGDERDLFVVDGRFAEGPVPGARSVPGTGFLTPGLVDCHAHPTLASPAGDAAPPRERAIASARLQLEAGVLAIREPGSPDDASRGIGAGDGLPRTITAGHLLTPPGRYFPGIGRDVREEDLPAAIEREARRSDGWVKVVGDWPGAGGRMRLTYRPTALAEAARRAHAAGARIAIHATCAETVEAAIAAGFDSVEHGWGIRPEHLPEMARRGIAFVPTLAMTMRLQPDLEGFLAGIGLGPAAVAEVAGSSRRHLAMTGEAHAAGVPVFAGTDAGMIPHGLVREEIGWLREAGLDGEAALAAGSWAARRFLGLPGFEAGAPADLVVYADDPRRDARALDRPALVMLGGRVLDLVPG